MTDRPLGLIAGEGIFPILVARGAKAAGRRVICAGFDGMADPKLVDEVDAYRPVSFVRVTSWTRFLRKHDVAEAIMVGRVAKQNLHVKNEMLWALRQVPDWATFWAWFTEFRHDRRSETVLLRTAHELEKRGVTLIDSTTFNKDQLADEGVMTRRSPTETEARAIERGWQLGGMLTREDVGQSMAVRDRDVLAIEATEGTDAMIRRAGDLCRGGGWVLLKRGNTRRDPRMDVPTIGLKTIETIKAAGASCVCVEAGHVMLLERDKVLAAANEAGLCIIGRQSED
ncbi:MAG: UDP-2,3-diacylglucosamine diphosphatase LpxI [Planctomycetota bacterium]